jgi:glycosyltransferase involved in cell wall biosynthesis
LPEQTSKARVLPFPSLFAFHPPEPGDPHETVVKYHLPEKFALVANQFWQHKNHRLVVEAVALLKARGVRVPVVMTGQPSDFRDPQNRTVSELLQRIAEAGLAGQVTVLGQVTYRELIALMRAAAVMIQPSQSEGWSTVVQDGKALGRPLICSGIATHREQAPEALGFFEWDGAADLAELLERHWVGLSPGPDAAREGECLEREREFARHHGRKLLQVCEEAAGKA